MRGNQVVKWAVCVLTVLAFGSTGLGLPKTWVGGEGGDWFAWGNWDPVGPMLPNDLLLVGSGRATTSLGWMIGPAGSLSLAGGEVALGWLDNTAGGTLELDAGTCTIFARGSLWAGDGTFEVGDGLAPNILLDLGAGSEVSFRDLTVRE